MRSHLKTAQDCIWVRAGTRGHEGKISRRMTIDEIRLTIQAESSNNRSTRQFFQNGIAANFSFHGPDFLLETASDSF